jgi:hypothetical protein
MSQAPVAHPCNPSYSGGRDQEDSGSKPTWANSEILSREYPTQIRVAYVEEYLPSKCEAQYYQEKKK